MDNQNLHTRTRMEMAQIRRDACFLERRVLELGRRMENMQDNLITVYVGTICMCIAMIILQKH